MNLLYSLCTRMEMLLGKWKWTVVGSGITCISHPTAANARVIKLRLPCADLRKPSKVRVLGNPPTGKPQMLLIKRKERYIKRPKSYLNVRGKIPAVNMYFVINQM